MNFCAWRREKETPRISNYSVTGSLSTPSRLLRGFHMTLPSLSSFAPKILAILGIAGIPVSRGFVRVAQAITGGVN